MSKRNEGRSCLTVLTEFVFTNRDGETGSSEGSSTDFSDHSSQESVCPEQAWETERAYSSGDSSFSDSNCKVKPPGGRKEDSEKDEILLVGSDSCTTDTVLITRSPSPRSARSTVDTWKCVSCKVENEWPLRYCAKCYRIRKGWLPQRPRKRRKKGKNASSQDSVATSSEVAGTSQETIASSFASQDSCTLEQQETAEPSGTLCAVCGLKPCDAVFLHGHTAHQMCCFSCSKKVWPKRRDCPVCRRKIENVIKVFRQRPVNADT